MATQVFPQVAIPVPTEQTAGNLALSSTTSQLDFVCGCSLFTQTDTTLTVGVEISHDGGTTWDPPGPTLTCIPPLKNKNGTTATQIHWVADLPDVGNANRRLRGYIKTSTTGSTSSITLGPGSITES